MPDGNGISTVSTMNNVGKFIDEDGVDAGIKRIGYKNSIDSATMSSVEAPSNGPNTIRPREPISIERKLIRWLRPPRLAAAPDATLGKELMPGKAKKEETKIDDAKSIDRPSPKSADGDATSAAEGTVTTSGGESNFTIMAAKRTAAAARSKSETKRPRQRGKNGQEDGKGAPEARERPLRGF